MGALDDLANFCVQHLGRLLTEWLLELFLLTLLPAITYGSNCVIHAIVGTNFERNFGNLLQIVLGASRNLTEENFLRDTASKGHAHSVDQLGGSEEETFRWQILKIFGLAIVTYGP